MKKIFTIIFACLATMTAMAQSDGSTVANAWGLNGNGTETDPYRISTAADLKAMAENCNAEHKGTGEYFKMTSDIDFGGSADSPVQLPAIGKDGKASTEHSTATDTPSAASTTPTTPIMPTANTTLCSDASTRMVW